MAEFPYTFICEKCGGTFYSKQDPSGWRHRLCNACSGKQYKDYPVGNAAPTYQPKPVPTKPTYNNVQPVKVERKEFNLDDYCTDLVGTYLAISAACEQAGLNIPVENLCAWTTGALIQKGKF